MWKKKECGTIRNGIKYFVTKCNKDVCMLSCRQHGFEYHYNKMPKSGISDWQVFFIPRESSAGNPQKNYPISCQTCYIASQSGIFYLNWFLTVSPWFDALEVGKKTLKNGANHANWDHV